MNATAALAAGRKILEMGRSTRPTMRQKRGTHEDQRPRATSMMVKVIHNPTPVAAARS